MKTRKMAAQQQTCRYRGNKCKILSGDNHLQFCDKHYKFHTDFLRNNPSILKKNQLDLLGSDTADLTKKKKRKHKGSILPPDEERCCRNDGMIWRCKKFRMKTKNYCQQHNAFNVQHSKDIMMKRKMKKKSGADFSKRVAETRDSNRFKRPGKRQLTVTDQPSTSNPTTSSDRIAGAGSVKIGAKRKRVVDTAMSGELKSLTGTRETRASKRRKMLMEGGESSNQPATNDNIESDGIVEGVPPKIGKKRKNVERTKGSGEPVIELESVELYKSNSEKIESEVRALQNESTQSDEILRDENNMSKPTTSSDKITEGASPKVWTKMKNVEITKGSGESVNDQLESVELYKSNCFELSMEPEKSKVELEKVEAELEKNEVELEKNEVEIEKKKVELEKNKMEPEKVKAELEKNEVEIEKNEVEIEKNEVELETNGVEPEKNK
ncbi:hypothetical protein MKX03_037127, partial [Papaver bracteatum]